MWLTRWIERGVTTILFVFRGRWYIYIYTYTYVCCVCVCVCERKRERERERERSKSKWYIIYIPGKFRWWDYHDVFIWERSNDNFVCFSCWMMNVYCIRYIVYIIYYILYGIHSYIYDRNISLTNRDYFFYHAVTPLSNQSW